MTRFASKTAFASALSALALGCTAIAGPGRQTGDGPLACTVAMTTQGGMVTLEGVATSDTPMSGDYHLRVARGGTLMTQDGPFHLSPGETERLGRVMLNGPARGLEVELTLDIDGEHFRCPADL